MVWRRVVLCRPVTQHDDNDAPLIIVSLQQNEHAIKAAYTILNACSHSIKRLLDTVARNF